MTQEEKAKAYDEALEAARKELKQDLHESGIWAIQRIFPELRESEDERIRMKLFHTVRGTPKDNEWFEEISKEAMLAWLEKQKEPENTSASVMAPSCWEVEQKENPKSADSFTDGIIEVRSFQRGMEEGRRLEKQKEQKPIKVEVYEIGKGTTIFGQDYKCKKDYKVGNCRYIKDAIYHCGRDGYLTDQNGVSWSCTPEWFNEYIQSNTEWAEEEKTRFVGGQFLQCKLSFDGFKEGEHYWLEYIGDDMYVGRSDNILNQKFHITPRQLYTLFSQQLDEVQGPPQEEKQVSLNYEPPFNENPSDKEIIEALIKHLKEQDGFLTAIDCVSTKAILSWLEKQKEQKSIQTFEEKEYIRTLKSLISDFIRDKKPADVIYYQRIYDWLDGRHVEQKPVEWSEEDEKMSMSILNLLCSQIAYVVRDGITTGKLFPTYANERDWFKKRIKSLRPSWKPSEEQMEALRRASTNEYLSAKQFDILVSLREQLEKLM